MNKFIYFRWNRWTKGLAVVVGLLAVYTIIGFWLLPIFIQNQVPKFVQTEMACQAAIGKVHFNPYTLRLHVQDLHLKEANGTPLLAIGTLNMQLQWQSLVRRTWSFAEIHIAAPSAYLSIARDGRFNFAEFIATLLQRPHQAPTDKSLPRIIINHFILEQGRVEVHDQRVGYDDLFFPISFALSNFSTLPEQNGLYTLSADSTDGGKLRWQGETSLNPIRGSGELTLENISLPILAGYLKPYTRAAVASGQLAATLPYRFSYNESKFEASITSAKLALRDLALVHENAKDSFAKLMHLNLNNINANLARREVTVGEMRADNGKLTVKRNAKGEFDLAQLLTKKNARPGPVVVEGAERATANNNWKLEVKQVAVDQVAISAVDETVNPSLQISADKAQLRLQLLAEQAGADYKLSLCNTAFSLVNMAFTSGSQTPFKLAQLGFTDGVFDLATRRVEVGRLFAEGGQLQLMRDRNGQLNILQQLPRFDGTSQQAATPTATNSPWLVAAKSIELSKFTAEAEDQDTGVKAHIQDFAVKLESANSDLTQPVKFTANMNLREGGQLAVQGEVVPAKGELEADVQMQQLTLLPLQPLLRKYVKLNLSGGNVSAQGQLTVRGEGTGDARLHYVGSFDIADLELKEESGERFATWKSMHADTLTASFAPNRLEVPLLRVIEPNTKLVIQGDRSINMARLLVQGTTAGTKDATQSAIETEESDTFPVRIRRVRFQNAKLDFSDFSLQPQFRAKIYELNGVVTGLSSSRKARSQVELDGRVDEFGLARIRGVLNLFAPRDNTELNIVFKNVNMVATTPYAMKFAGYKIAEGKMSLDLQYKVQKSLLQGDNKIIIDNLLLGERVDSPNALKLPLELAIAVLKDRNGRIDLGLPVSGDLRDPQFSYGAVIWKAIGSLLNKIVTAPFRALGSLFGSGGQELEAIDFDPGSDKLLPPEREKLKQVAQILTQRAQLKLAVPSQYSEEVDGAALKARAVRLELAKRAGLKLEDEEELGPVDLRDRAMRRALREMYAERFGAEELDKQKKAAEEAASRANETAASDNRSEASQQKVRLWQRVGNLIQGEPQVADARAFYHKLQERLEQTQLLLADALPSLGAQRASAILSVLKEAGVDPTRLIEAAPEKINSNLGKSVQLKLGLAAK